MNVKDLYANRFTNNHVQRNTIWKIFCKDFFQKFISSKDTVLDMPVGYGEFINNIHCRQKIACDINPDSKNFVAKNVTFLHGSSIRIALKSSSIDKIFISNFFEHITHEEITKTIKECFRILKKNGQVLVLQPNVRFCYKDYWMFFDHITPIDDRGLAEVFELYKFKLVYKIEKFLPYTSKTSLPKYPLLVWIYIHSPILWKVFGKQSFLIFEK